MMTDDVSETPERLYAIVKNVLRVGIFVGLVYISYKATNSYLARQKVLRAEHMQVACPTLFSVARTPRDTLLVMRSEEACIEYVMKTLR